MKDIDINDEEWRKRFCRDVLYIHARQGYWRYQSEHKRVKEENVRIEGSFPKFLPHIDEIFGLEALHLLATYYADPMGSPYPYEQMQLLKDGAQYPYRDFSRWARERLQRLCTSHTSHALLTEEFGGSNRVFAPMPKSLLLEPIEALNLPVAITGYLKNAGCGTLGLISTMTAEEVRGVRGIGPIWFSQLTQIIERMGIRYAVIPELIDEEELPVEQLDFLALLLQCTREDALHRLTVAANQLKLTPSAMLALRVSLS